MVCESIKINVPFDSSPCDSSTEHSIFEPKKKRKSRASYDVSLFEDLDVMCQNSMLLGHD